jgi:ribosomal protein S12 methylthiotransferase accessory factor
MLEGSYHTLVQQGKKVLDLDDLCSYLPWQKKEFPRFQYDEHSSFRWVQTTELVSGRRVYVPAQLVFWGYTFGGENPEPTLRQGTTSGSAGHFTFEESALSALYECVERDAFLLFWLNTTAPPVLDLATVTDPAILECIEFVQQNGLELHILDTTADIHIPSCVCVVRQARG